MQDEASRAGASQEGKTTSTGRACSSHADFEKRPKPTCSQLNLEVAARGKYLISISGRVGWFAAARQSSLHDAVGLLHYRRFAFCRAVIARVPRRRGTGEKVSWLRGKKTLVRANAREAVAVRDNRRQRNHCAASLIRMEVEDALMQLEVPKHKPKDAS